MYPKFLHIFSLIFIVTSCEKLATDPDAGSSDVQQDSASGLNYWGGEYNDLGHAVVQTADGGYAVVGSQFSAANNEDLYIVKFDTELNISSEKAYAGTVTDAEDTDNTFDNQTYTSMASDIQQTADGGYITVGSTFNGTDYDVWVVKFTADVTATPAWEAVISGTAGYNDFGNSIQQMESGKYLVCGTSFDGIDNEIKLWSVDGDGANATSLYSTSNTTPDAGNYAQQTSDGGFVIVATSSGSITVTKLVQLTAGTYAVNTALCLDGVSADQATCEAIPSTWVAAFGTAGSVTLTSGANTVNEGVYVQQLADGSYIVIGNTEAGIGKQSELYINTVTAAGVQGTGVTMGDSGPDKVACVRQTNDGGFVITGNKFDSVTKNDVWVVKLSPARSTEWDFTYGGNLDDMGNSIFQTDDGGYVITGSTMSYGNQSQIVLLKINSSGVSENLIGQLSTSGN